MISPKDDKTFTSMSFPAKLYSLLEDAETFGFQDVIFWQEGGKSFKIRRSDTFELTVMQSYFTQTKLKSFQRQLNMYGFKQVQVGPEKGGYYHNLFLRGSPLLCAKIIRRHRERHPPSNIKKVTALPVDCDLREFCQPGSLPKSNVPQQQTTFFVAATAVGCTKQASIQLEESEISTFFNFFYPQNPAEKIFMDTFFFDDTDCSSPVPPLSSSAADFLKNLKFDERHVDELVSVLEQQHCDNRSTSSGPHQRDEVSSFESENSFPFKLHLMLENSKRDNYSHVVSWVKNGSAFKVHKPQEFVEQVLPMYFDQSKIESFRKQCNLYKFTRQAKGVDRGVISHPFLMEGARWLCNQIKSARHS